MVSKFPRFLLTIVSVACLTSWPSAQSVMAAGPKERAPIGQFTAVKLEKAPVIDGKISPGEWDGALTTSGVLAAFDELLIAAPTTMSVGFDDTRLYFLFQCVRSPGEARLTKKVRSNDDYSFGDPSVEVWVSPPARVPETYQNILNTYPAVLDAHMIPSRGYTAQGWKGNWTLGVTEDPDSYIIEASIPIADFSPQAIKDGDVWRLLLCRSALRAWPRPQGSWSVTTGFAEIPQHPPVKLSFDDVAVQWRDTHTILNSDYKMPVTIVAPRRGDAKLRVEMRWHKGATPGDPSDVVDARDLSLKAGAKQTLNFAGQVPQAWTRAVSIEKEKREVPGGYVTLTVTRDGASAEQAIFRQTIPYAATGYVPTRPVLGDKDKIEPLSLLLRYGPQSNVMLLRADILDLPERDKVVGGVVRLLDPQQGNKVLLEKPLPGFEESYSDASFSLQGVPIPLQDHSAQDAAYGERRRVLNTNNDRKKLREAAANRKPKPGETAVDPATDPALQPLPVPEVPAWTPARPVLVEVTVKDAAGKSLASVTQEVSLLQHKFTWQNNNIGISDQVIPPWSPVKFDKGLAEVWNRKLQLDGLAMLKSADNGGTQQIRSMKLIAIKDGQPVEITAGQPQVEKLTPAAATFTGSGSGAGLKLSNRSTLEFDGYTLNDLTIAPEAGTAKIDKLYLEVVLPEAEATHFCASAGNWSAVHDETPKHWSSQQTSSGVLIGDFVPYVWLTNSDRGFLWVADNDKGWITEDQKKHPTQEVIRKDGTVTLRIHFIEIPSTLTAPTTLRYAYQTFPARPMPEGWRSWVCNGSGKPPTFPSARRTYFFPDFNSDWAVLWPYYSSPFAWSWDRTKKWMDHFANRPDHRPTVGQIAHSIGRYQDWEGRQFPELSVDWGEFPGQIGNSDITQSRGPIDFRLFNYEHWIKQCGLRAMYFDETYLGLDKNALTGGAYLRSDGRLQAGYTYLGLRDFYKRLMYVFHESGVSKPNIWLHTTSGAGFHALLGDILMEGENVAPTDLEFDYLDVLPAARMRAIASPRVTGSAMLMMCQATRSPTQWVSKHIHQFVGWVQAHDVLPEQIDWHFPIAQSAQFHRDDVTFIGYWHAHVPVKATTPECVVSVHRTSGPPSRALLWIVNTSRKDQAVDVAIDWKQLGLKRESTIAVNAETGEEIAIKSDALRVPVLQRDFVAVHLVQRDVLKGSQSFAATFDRSTEAEEAIGSTVLAGAAELVSSDRGQALSVAAPVTFLPHLNLVNESGRLSFRAKFRENANGTVLRSQMPGSKPGQTPLPAGFVIEVRRGNAKTPAALVIRSDAKPAQGQPAPESILLEGLTPGWHEVTLTWNGGELTVALDGSSAAKALNVGTMAMPTGTGPEILRGASFVIGGGAANGAIEAIDDLRAWRAIP